jgi:L-amino acid N-acyltransferase YncA
LKRVAEGLQTPVEDYEIRDATSEDAQGLALVYNQGIEDKIATFETGSRDAEERRGWLKTHDKGHPVLVAVRPPDGDVLGWAAITPISERPCYSGVGEYSVYVRRDSRGLGVGSSLLKALVARAKVEGYWKLIGRMFTFNEGSRRLSKRFGFREVGILEKHGKLDGKWIDVLEIERLIPENIS